MFPSPSISSILESLKSSLSRILPLFFPFAGKLTHISSTGSVSIDCSAASIDGGITFIEAELDGEIHRLSGEEKKDLMPDLDSREFPAPMLAIQVTRLGREGMGLGFAVHHVVADGKAVWRFMEEWAAACRGGGNASVASAEAEHDREVIQHQGGDGILKHLAPLYHL